VLLVDKFELAVLSVGGFQCWAMQHMRQMTTKRSRLLAGLMGECDVCCVLTFLTVFSWSCYLLVAG
jgi:hypothetical protein